MLVLSRKRLESVVVGGALGFEHLLIKSHGRSNARAVKNAVKVAAKAVRDGVTHEITTAIEQL